MSVTFCIKYALGFVTVDDVTWVFDGAFGEKLVIKVSELIKDDKYSGKKFKIFFIECDKEKQTKGKLDKLAANIIKNATTGDKKGARITIDKAGHYWQVVFAKEQAPKEQFKPSIVEEAEPTVKELEAAMEALQTKEELEFLHGTKRSAAEEGEITEPKRERISGVFEAEISRDDPIYKEALKDTIAHFSELGLYPPR